MRFTAIFSSTLALIGISLSFLGLMMQSEIKVYLPQTSQTPNCLMYDWENEVIITIDKQLIVEVQFGHEYARSHSFQYRPPEQNTLSIKEISSWQRKHDHTDVVVFADKSLSFPIIRDILYSLKITKIHKAHFIARF